MPTVAAPRIAIEPPAAATSRNERLPIAFMSGPIAPPTASARNASARTRSESSSNVAHAAASRPNACTVCCPEIVSSAKALISPIAFCRAR